MKKTTVRALAVVAALALAAPVVAQVKVDSSLSEYKTVSGVSGSLSSVGSDTLNNLMTYWAESFSKFYPSAKIQIEGKGSSTAPPALISGRSTSSRRSTATSRRRCAWPSMRSPCS
jgi:phosphate transport system substrate-binding protein